MGTFAARTRELSDMIGHGKLTGKVKVDQVYAASIHEGYWRTGPLAGHTNRPRHGGQHFFLQQPLFTEHPKWLEDMAIRTLQPDGLVRSMRDAMEDLSREVFDKAPREFEDLRNSAHPTVTDGEQTVYDRPPVRGRLSKSDLKRKAKLRSLGEGPG